MLDTNKIYRVLSSPTTHWYATFTNGVITEHHSLKRAQQVRPDITITELIAYEEYANTHLPVRLGATGRQACTCGDTKCSINPLVD